MKAGRYVERKIGQMTITALIQITDRSLLSEVIKAPKVLQS